MSTSISPEAPAVVKETEKKKRGTNRKPIYVVAEGTKLEATPEDFDPDKQRMTKAMFKDTPLFMEHQAHLLDLRAAKLRADAVEYRINPPKRGNKAAKLMARLTKLEDKLKSLGIDVEDLFAEDAE